VAWGLPSPLALRRPRLNAERERKLETKSQVETIRESILAVGKLSINREATSFKKKATQKSLKEGDKKKAKLIIRPVVAILSTERSTWEIHAQGPKVHDKSSSFNGRQFQAIKTMKIARSSLIRPRCNIFTQERSASPDVLVDFAINRTSLF